MNDFETLTEPHRRELLAHCYRMLGSRDDAEDLVQDTYLRAWRSWASFEGRSSVRTWLYRIATNACLTAIEGRRRLALPSGLGAPSDDPDTDPEPAPDDVAWITPFPVDPADAAIARESLRLALVAGLQRLPGRQRAVLLLRDVLGFSAAEVASMLAVSVPAVKSALQRARAASGPLTVEPVAGEQEILDLYIRGFENSDLGALERALRADAALEPVGTSTWFSGNATCLRYLRRVLFEPGDWRMRPVHANGQPAVATWFRGAPFGLAVLDIVPGGIRQLVVYGQPGLIAAFIPADSS